MILLIILLIPFLTGLSLLFFRKAGTARTVALISTVVNLLLTLSLLNADQSVTYSAEWINYLGIQFSLGYDGISTIMLLLTNLLFPFIVMAGFGRDQKNVPMLNCLILCAQSALIGVFLAQNAFLFYVFWELALIPVYFILLVWGGDDRKAITLKFFIYTLAGSLFLLFGIIYLYQLTPGTHTTDFSAFSQLQIPAGTQNWLFWILFIAFAIKMPIFPFHTWQPPTYKMASTQGVMILAGVMTKMGIYGALRFLFPVVPLGVLYWQNLVIIMSLTGVIYASVIAYKHTNLKTMIAYSSMAHISLMAAALFVLNSYAYQGLIFQVLSHGVTIAALFYVACLVKEQTGTTEMPQLGGLKINAPNMAILFLIILLGSIALPLTAGFVGEFLMITGLFQQSIWFALFGGLTMILGAIYMLYAYQRVMLGDKKLAFAKATDLGALDYWILIPLIVVILGLGIYPQPIFDILKPVAEVFSGLAH
ncbi:NADH-ubiquinone oxidoreductase chain M [Aquipluma nitroreducens]|uniref:NADH-ubiquinone oxidoreductase chain M n=1 Tax=Aquipluma nitroreducens TaxID=2010828 RepID=A0A5K7S5H4_9BACT|nr:NADH-quinone oxidoreductase subunit M [Aquipluma nitroreducens]BBE16604.1 NADH-ubiquinone oxidoreductase chain M [Aquipluma nitroreducens]